jgi:hypothetical protein
MSDTNRPEGPGGSWDNAEWRDRLEKLWRWLKARPLESWLFLVAGLLIGRFIL